jgi:hypothetical protein
MEGEQNNVNVSGEKNGSSAGPIIAVIVILAIIILGGLYFWGERSSDEATIENPSVDSINTQSEDDDTSSIEADLDATQIENVDAELNAS